MVEIVAALIIAVIGALIGVFARDIRSVVKAWFRHLNVKARSVEPKSKYRIQSIRDIVIDEAKKDGINLESLRFEEDFTITDLEIFCRKVYSVGRPDDEIRRIIRQARSTAFTTKYSEPKEDEKLVNPSIIRLQDVGNWESYFLELLSNLGVNDLNAVDILDVGIGNGHAYVNLLKNVNSFRGADISDKALALSRATFPQMVPIHNDAEDLNDVETSSVDLYVSLRTYPSTLFDRRMAIHEAYRVLRMSGIIVISVPIMFLKTDGHVLKGLMRPGSYEPEMQYAEEMVNRISGLLRTLNFKEIGTNTDSPFEIYVHAKR